MTRPVHFELHSAPRRVAADQMLGAVADDNELVSILSLQFGTGVDALAWVAVDATDTLHLVDNESESVAGFAIVQRRLGSSLAIIPRTPDVLLNGMPALPFHVLVPRDSLVLSPGMMTYVTERFSPYVGAALQEHIGKRCPCCKIKISDQTHVVTCRCGCVYHHETQESHPESQEDDRLNCFEKVQACLSCSRPLTLDPVLVWDPAEIQ